MWFLIVRDLYFVLLIIAVVEWVHGSELLHDTTRNGVVCATACVLAVKLLLPLLGGARSAVAGAPGSRSSGSQSSATQGGRGAMRCCQLKKTHSGKTEVLEWASSEMQGWRPAMEDAVCTVLSMPEPLSQRAMFAVFDGHGGAQVSRIVAQELPKAIASETSRHLRLNRSNSDALPGASDAGNAGIGSADTNGDIRGETKAEGEGIGESGMLEVPSELNAEDNGGIEATPDSADHNMCVTVGPPSITELDSGIVSASPEVMEAVLHDAMLGMDGFLFKSGEGHGPANYLPPAAAAAQRLKPQPEHQAVRNAFNFVGSTAIIVLLEFRSTMDSSEPHTGALAASALSPVSGAPWRISVANCGDSRALLCRGGRCLELSEDHKPECPIEEKRIQKAGGHVARIGPCHRVDGWGLNLSRAFGDFHYKSRADLPAAEQKVIAVPELRSMELTKDDEFLVLACDGVFELLTSENVVDVVRQALQKGLPVETVVEKLLDQCVSPSLVKTRGKGGDNCSAIIVKFR